MVLAGLLESLYGDLRAPEHQPQATFRVTVGFGHDRTLVFRDDLALGGGRLASTAMSLLTWGINRWVLERASRQQLVLHAGAVTTPSGITVVLPAPSESGKSTLTLALLDRGCGYVSDEAVATRPDGTIRGFARPIAIDPGAWSLFPHHRPDPERPETSYLERQWHLPAGAIARVVASAKLDVVVFPRYAPGAATSLDRLRPSEALSLIAGSTFPPEASGRVGNEQLVRLSTALRGVPAYRLLTNDLAEACDSVIDVATVA